MKKLFIVLPLVLMFLILAIIGPASAQTQVFGKVTLHKNAIVVAAISQTEMFRLQAYEEQTFYIIDVLESEGKKVWIADGSGFVHNCSKHGREVLDINMFLLIPQDLVDNGTIDAILEIF